MTHGTEEKILEAALIEFSKHGYAGAKTKEIAIRSGLSEMTLFRRFKSKKNLFDQVLLNNQKKINQEYSPIFEFKGTDDPIQYFKNLINSFWKITYDNFEFISLMSLESEQITSDMNAELINALNEIFISLFPHKKVHSRAIVIGICSFIFVGVLEENMSRKNITRQDFDNYMDFILNCLK